MPGDDSLSTLEEMVDEGLDHEDDESSSNSDYDSDSSSGSDEE